MANLKLPKALIQYIEETDFETMHGDAFILFINVYDDNSTPEHVTAEFTNKLLKSIEFI